MKIAMHVNDHFEELIWDFLQFLKIVQTVQKQFQIFLSYLFRAFWRGTCERPYFILKKTFYFILVLQIASFLLATAR